MATGIITTARGESLNIDELIAKGSRPVEPVAKSTTEATPYRPSAEQPKIRGFVPTAGTSTLEQTSETPVEEKPTAVRKKKVTKSDKKISDETRIVVSKTAKKVSKSDTVAKTEEDDELGELLNKLDT